MKRMGIQWQEIPCWNPQQITKISKTQFTRLSQKNMLSTMSFQASITNCPQRGLRQCFVHLSGRTSGHKWWIPLWQLCFVVEQRISFKQAFDPNTALPIYGFTFPPFCEAKIHWKNLNPSNSEASPTVTDQTNSPILTLKMKVDGRWLSFSKGLFFFFRLQGCVHF